MSNVYCIHVWLCAILYHTISYYFILYHTISYYIILYHTISYYIYICIIYHNIIIHKYISFGSFFSCSKRSGGRASWQRCCARDHRDSKRSSARCLEHPGSHGMDYIYMGYNGKYIMGYIYKIYKIYKIYIYMGYITYGIYIYICIYIYM